MVEVLWQNLREPELKALSDDDAIVLVPVGSIEQHGPHLPVNVDALLATEVARRAAVIVLSQTAIVVAPTVWMGLAEHHMTFGGTFTLDFPTFNSLLRCLCRSITRLGFRRIVFVNGHGGNINPLKIVVDELTHEFKTPIMSCAYWHAASKEFGEILEKQATVLHAGEAETSMYLALKPELVAFGSLDGVEPPQSFETRDPFDTRLYHWQTMTSFTKSGVLGDPRAASAEKGEKLLDAAAKGVAAPLLDRATWDRHPYND